MLSDWYFRLLMLRAVFMIGSQTNSQHRHFILLVCWAIRILAYQTVNAQQAFNVNGVLRQSQCVFLLTLEISLLEKEINFASWPPPRILCAKNAVSKCK